MLTPDQIADGWLPHDGGTCPVPLDSRPAVMFRDGFDASDNGEWLMASQWVFGGNGQNLWMWQRHGPADIIAYKEEPKP